MEETLLQLGKQLRFQKQVVLSSAKLVCELAGDPLDVPRELLFRSYRDQVGIVIRRVVVAWESTQPLKRIYVSDVMMAIQCGGR